MKWFERKEIKKESNIARTPEQSTAYQKKLTKQGVFFLLWNILSIALYSSYTLFVIYKLSEKNFLSKIIIYLLVIYAVIFIVLLIISIGNKTKLKFRLKNFKSATNFLKYAVQIINFTLSIITAISAFVTTGLTDISTMVYGVLSMFITLIFILVEIAKIIVRKNIPLIKRNFLEIREEPETQKKDHPND